MVHHKDMEKKRKEKGRRRENKNRNCASFFQTFNTRKKKRKKKRKRKKKKRREREEEERKRKGKEKRRKKGKEKERERGQRKRYPASTGVTRYPLGEGFVGEKNKRLIQSVFTQKPIFRLLTKSAPLVRAYPKAKSRPFSPYLPMPAWLALAVLDAASHGAPTCWRDAHSPVPGAVRLLAPDQSIPVHGTRPSTAKMMANSSWW